MKLTRLPALLGVLLGVATYPVAAADPAAAPSASDHVLGIGGVFFKADDPARVGDWYRRHLGMEVGEDGFAHLLWRDFHAPAVEQRTVWSVFPRASEYFGNSRQQWMINYIVRDLDGLLDELRAAGVEQVGDVEAYDYGRFAWFIDVEGNRFELWEPAGPAPAEP